MRAALLAAALLLAAAPAATAVVCQRRNATLVLRDACRKRENTIDLTQIGYRGPQGPRGRGLYLVDGNGRTVPGFIAPLGEGSSFVYRAGTRIVFSQVNRDGFVNTAEFVHEEPGCAGPRLLRQEKRRLARFARVLDGIALFADDPIEVHTVVSAESAFYVGADCTAAGGSVLPNGLCCLENSAPSESEAGPVATFELSTLGVVPPFHLEFAP